MKQYKYYSTQRPIDSGTYPNLPDNKPLKINRYDKRRPVEGGKMQAWGDLTYAKPLSKKQVDDYELKPASDNPCLQSAAMPLKENDDVKKLLDLLSSVGDGKAKEFSQLIHYVDMMEKRLELVNAELMEVRSELAGIKHSPVKQAFTATIAGIENGLQKTKKELAEIKEQIVKTAAQAVESVKQTGLSALKKTLSFIGVKDMLNHLRGGLNEFISDTKGAIAKVENIGEEFRSAGAHLKQAGRAAIGRERLEVDVSKEGRFQAGLVTLLRSVQSAMAGIERTAGNAVKQLERLEQEKKPSVRENLQALAKKHEKGAYKVKAKSEATL